MHVPALDIVRSEQTSVALTSELPLTTPVLLSFSFKWKVSNPQWFPLVALIQKLLLTEMLQDLSYLARYSLSPTLHVLVCRASLGKILVPDGSSIGPYSSAQESTSSSSLQPSGAAKAASKRKVIRFIKFDSPIPLAWHPHVVQR